jgi:uncharacterized SAM-binding protein YcdF (DUF218 family)
MPLPSFLKPVFVPGSIAFFNLCVILYLMLRYVWPRNPRVSRAWAIVITGIYLVMGVPFVANNIADRLGQPVVAGPSLPPVDMLIILDGDNRVGRVKEGYRVWTTAQPRIVYTLGGDWIRDALVAKGVPVSRITQNSGGTNTLGQMEWVGRLLTKTPSARAALIVSRLQMPRVAALARSANLPLILVASPVDDEPPRTGISQFVPTYIGLRVSRDALYEHAALAFYSWRGWIA